MVVTERWRVDSRFRRKYNVTLAVLCDCYLITVPLTLVTHARDHKTDILLDLRVLSLGCPIHLPSTWQVYTLNTDQSLKISPIGCSLELRHGTWDMRHVDRNTIGHK